MKITASAVKRRIATSVIVIGLVTLGAYGLVATSGELCPEYYLSADQGVHFLAGSDA